MSAVKCSSAKIERLRKLLKELEREYYEKCDGIGWDGNECMQGYCKWLCIEIERLEKRIKALEKGCEGGGRDETA